jgi:hypothetical protein
MGHDLIFIMQGGGTWGVLLMFGHENKNGPILQQPQVWGGNECLLIGNWRAH